MTDTTSQMMRGWSEKMETGSEKAYQKVERLTTMDSQVSNTEPVSCLFLVPYITATSFIPNENGRVYLTIGSHFDLKTHSVRAATLSLTTHFLQKCCLYKIRLLYASSATYGLRLHSKTTLSKFYSPSSVFLYSLADGKSCWYNGHLFGPLIVSFLVSFCILCCWPWLILVNPDFSQGF